MNKKSMFYAESHEWVRLEDSDGHIALVGITEYARHELGEIVYVECPKVGKVAKKGEIVAVLESTKAAVDVYSPVSGTIIEVNTQLAEYPELINNDPEKAGWIFRLRLEDKEELSTLLSETAYLEKTKKK